MKVTTPRASMSWTDLRSCQRPKLESIQVGFDIVVSLHLCTHQLSSRIFPIKLRAFEA
jgi:hypothetical protein